MAFTPPPGLGPYVCKDPYCQSRLCQNYHTPPKLWNVQRSGDGKSAQQALDLVSSPESDASAKKRPREHETDLVDKIDFSEVENSDFHDESQKYTVHDAGVQCQSPSMGIDPLSTQEGIEQESQWLRSFLTPRPTQGFNAVGPPPARPTKSEPRISDSQIAKDKVMLLGRFSRPHSNRTQNDVGQALVSRHPTLLYTTRASEATILVVGAVRNKDGATTKNQCSANGAKIVGAAEFFTQYPIKLRQRGFLWEEPFLTKEAAELRDLRVFAKSLKVWLVFVFFVTTLEI